MTDKMREAFEAWLEQDGRFALAKRETIGARWQAWQAARRQGGKAVDAITKATADYARGRDVHEIFKDLKDVERDNS